MKKPKNTQRISNDTNVYSILVEGTEKPEYWLCIDAHPSVTLKKLDKFLKRLWLECCGHMSAFEIDGTRYYPDSESRAELGGQNMDFSLAQLISKGKKFAYEYDFGSTTYLSLRILSERKGSTGNGKIMLLARNNPPPLKCEFCGWMATQICGVCDGESGITCDRCMKRHECGEEMFLPLVNSPRTGVCGYCGGPETKPIMQRGWVPSNKI